MHNKYSSVWRRGLSVLLSLLMALSAFGALTFTAGAVSYIDENGEDQTYSGAIEHVFDCSSWSTGWYLLDWDVTISERVNVNGDVHLILGADYTLTAQAGITLRKNSSLTIYCENDGQGMLIATGDDRNAGIGGERVNDVGSITICGGTVEATGGEGAAGIGGGEGGNCGNVTIYGGTVTAYGGGGAAGIGGGYDGDGGNVTIYGGTVTAYGSDGAAGIGGGEGGNGGVVKIYGGTVNAYRVDFNYSTFGRGIGGNDDGTLEIYGGTVNGLDYIGYCDENGDVQHISFDDCRTLDEYSEDHTLTIWSGGWYVIDHDYTIGDRVTLNGDVKLILVDGCTLTANKGINVGASSSLTVYGQRQGTGKLTAAGEYSCAAIGGTAGEAVGPITICGGTVEATGLNVSAGIGGGEGGNGGKVTIYGGTVTANGTYYGAGIGGGYKGGNGGKVTIYGGTVTANGGNSAAGIGGGDGGSGGDVYIYGGSVTATGKSYGAGIGGGDGGSGANVYIYGGTVEASGGYYGGENIGAGDGGANSGTLKINGGTVNGVCYDQVITPPVPIENLAYTGFPQVLVTAGSATFGTMMYCVAGYEPEQEKYSADLPVAVTEGTHTVWYYVDGGDERDDTEPACVEVTIGEGELTIPDGYVQVPISNKTAPHNLVAGDLWFDGSFFIDLCGTDTFGVFYNETAARLIVIIGDGVWSSDDDGGSRLFEDLHIVTEPVHTFVYTSNGDGTHKVTCTGCDYLAAAENCDYTAVDHASTCETGAYKTCTCKYCEYSYDTEPGAPLGHDWRFVSFEWAADSKTAKVNLVCSRDPDHTTQADAEMSKTFTAATGEAGACTVYTATYGTNTDSRTVTDEGPDVCELCGEVHDVSTISGFFIDYMHDLLFVIKQLTVGLAFFMFS